MMNVGFGAKPYFGATQEASSKGHQKGDIVVKKGDPHYGGDTIYEYRGTKDDVDYGIPVTRIYPKPFRPLSSD